MNAGEKQTNHKNQRTAVPQGTAHSYPGTAKLKRSGSLFKRIILLLKKEELI